MTYQVHLQQFDGPLDLLLHLIEQAEVDIKDIFISEITAQYLAYMDELDKLDMDTASEFLNMAATLVYIKSRSLLPKPPKDDLEEEDPEVALIRQLREYKAFKEAGAQLELLFQRAYGMFSKLPEEFILPPQEIMLDETSIDCLFNAFLVALNKERFATENLTHIHEVSADRFTVRMQLVKIRGALKEQESITFDSLFDAASTKMEMIVTFMALLDMIARNEITLKQNQPYSPITITAHRLIDYDEDIEYMDEQ